jgi:hypothetical protein
MNNGLSEALNDFGLDNVYAGGNPDRGLEESLGDLLSSDDPPALREERARDLEQTENEFFSATRRLSDADDSRRPNQCKRGESEVLQLVLRITLCT